MKKLIGIILLVGCVVVGLRAGRSVQDWMTKHSLEERALLEQTTANVEKSAQKIADSTLQLEELRYANLLHDSWADSKWLKNKQFSPNKAAANYSLLYVLFRALDEVHPASVLEMGLGQTTHMTTQYAKYFQAKLDVIEDDQQWIDIYKDKLPVAPNTRVHQRPIVTFDYRGRQSEKYDDLSEIVGKTRYNLIVIDGPIGYRSSLSRSNILDLIPQNLADDFVIIFDDVERPAEKETVRLLEEKLRANNIRYAKSVYPALKTQLVLAGGNYQFVTFL